MRVVYTKSKCMNSQSVQIHTIFLQYPSLTIIIKLIGRINKNENKKNHQLNQYLILVSFTKLKFFRIFHISLTLMYQLKLRYSYKRR